MPIQVGDNFSYKGTKPLDARTKYATVADMKNATASDLYDGCLAYVDATKKNYQYDSSNTVDPDTGKWRELQTGGGGTTYTAGDGIVIENAEISVDEMASSDMEEIVTPLPSVMSRRFKYSTSEQIVGEWIDGKPIYQKTFQITVPSTTDGNMVDGVYDVLDLNIDKCIYVMGRALLSSGNNITLAPYNSTVSGYFIKGNADLHENKIRLYTNASAFSDLTYDVTIQYTKTTD